MSSVLKNSGLLTVVAFALAMTVTACGPSQSAREQQLHQTRSDNQKTADEYSIVVGKYSGLVVSEDGKEYKSELRIYLATISQVNAGTSTPVEIPTLAGGLTIHTPNLEDNESFTSGTYNQDTGNVTMYSAATAGSSAAPVVMNLKYAGGKLTGQFCSLKCNTVTLKRVSSTPKHNNSLPTEKAQD